MVIDKAWDKAYAEGVPLFRFEQQTLESRGSPCRTKWYAWRKISFQLVTSGVNTLVTTWKVIFPPGLRV